MLAVVTSTLVADMQLTDADVEGVKQEIVQEMIDKLMEVWALEQLQRTSRALLWRIVWHVQVLLRVCVSERWQLADAEGSAQSSVVLFLLCAGGRCHCTRGA